MMQMKRNYIVDGMKSTIALCTEMYPEIESIMDFRRDYGFEYVNIDFVTAMLNKTEIMCAYALLRYRSEFFTSDEFEQRVDKLKDIPYSEWHHTKISRHLEDDCIVFGRMKHSGDILVGWLDCDTSDCAIYRIYGGHYYDGFEEDFVRFLTQKGHDTVLSCLRVESGIKAYTKMRTPSGWISF